jgi:Cytochrome c554 and c-prime
LIRLLAFTAVVLAVALALAGVAPPRAAPPDPGVDPTEALGQNAACLVCHLTFVKEDLARTHQLKGVACVRCHGPSIKHANDENIGATKPDLTFTRDRIDPACVLCHKHHNAPARAVVARFLERRLPPQPAPSCTDCHGTHRIEKASTPSPG